MFINQEELLSAVEQSEKMVIHKGKDKNTHQQSLQKMGSHENLTRWIYGTHINESCLNLEDACDAMHQDYKHYTSKCLDHGQALSYFNMIQNLDNQISQERNIYHRKKSQCSLCKH